MGIRAASLSVLLAAALSLGGAERADALSCGAPDRPYSEINQVVFDGVLLSGPRESALGRLASPARIQVMRYLKGRGPSVVEIGTDVPLLTPGDDPGVYSFTPGLFDPFPGQVYRIYSDTPKGAGSSTKRGVLTPHPCGGTYERRTGTYLRGVKGSRVAKRDPGGRRWAAELLRGPGSLRCLRVHPGLGVDSLECERVPRRDQLVAAYVPAGGDSWATAIAVRAPDLESISVGAFPHAAEAKAKGAGRIALAVIPGYHEAADMTVTARLTGNRSVPVQGSNGGLLLVDPRRDDLRWGLARAPAHPPAAGIACAVFEQRPDASRPGSAGDAPRHGECGREDGFFAVRHIERYSDSEKRYRYASIVFGVAPPGTERVVVEAPDGEREASSLRFPLFGVMLPAGLEPGDLTIAFHRPGQAPLRVAGQRDWNVVSPPRSSLDSDY